MKQIKITDGLAIDRRSIRYRFYIDFNKRTFEVRFLRYSLVVSFDVLLQYPNFIEEGEGLEEVTREVVHEAAPESEEEEEDLYPYP